MYSGDVYVDKHRIYIDDDTWIIVYDDVYEPAEDTWLLLSIINPSKIEDAMVIDTCSGSGVIGIYLATRYNPRRTILIDIMESAVRNIAENLELHGISNASVLRCNLLSCIHDRVADIVTANPPYLPGPRRPGYEAYESGPQGYEIPVELVQEASRVLRCRGSLYMVFSSRTGINAVFSALKRSGFKIIKTASKHFFFEDITAVEAELVECRESQGSARRARGGHEPRLHSEDMHEL